MDSHEFRKCMPLVCSHVYVCIHMCYSHVLSGWNALMSAFMYVHVFTCAHRQTCRFRKLPRSEIFSLMAAALFYILPYLLLSLTPTLTLLSMRYWSKMFRKGFRTHESINTTLLLYFYDFDLFWRPLTASERLNKAGWAGAGAVTKGLTQIIGQEQKCKKMLVNAEKVCSGH